MFFGNILMTVLSDKDLRQGAAKALQKGANFIADVFDDDGDGSIESDDFTEALELQKNFVSIMALMANIDGSISDDEETQVYEIIEDLFLDSEDTEAFFTQQLLDSVGVKKRDLINQLMKVFEKPYSLTDIIGIAKKYELESTMYIYACILAYADKDVNPKEREFLDQLSEKLELNRIEKKKIEKETFL
jgi:uncharacterized membrane protein YebE (DUF533 family)